MPAYQYLKQEESEINHGREYVQYMDNGVTNSKKGFFGNAKGAVDDFFKSTIPASGLFGSVFSSTPVPQPMTEKKDILNEATSEPKKAHAYIYLKNIEWAIEKLKAEYADTTIATEPKDIKDLLEKADPDIFKEPGFDINKEQPQPEDTDDDKAKAKKLLAAYLVNFHEEELRLLLGRPKIVSPPPPPPPAPASSGVSLHGTDAVPPKTKSTGDYTDNWNKKLDEIAPALKAKFELDFKGHPDTTKGFSVKYKHAIAGKETEIIKFDAAGAATLNQKACEANGLSRDEQVNILIASYVALHTDKTKQIAITHDDDEVSKALVKAIETKLKTSHGYNNIIIKSRTPAAAPSAAAAPEPPDLTGGAPFLGRR
jgi:hypothetical protein